MWGNLTFTELMRNLIETETIVTIGASGNELHGVILAYDTEARVLTYQDTEPDGARHFVPLSSIRSIGLEESSEGTFAYIDLFKK
ncbi:hypothetical protein [Gorillibacterium massiliense]|uniref:hypothetical protein n=1 Tax=Gorillibacterium massiliense TaxID=1280390 RepID=UPI0004AFA4A6|nr:hypothetical protein [Gorillibacterium massiliense]